jgi:hypothetical protein
VSPLDNYRVNPRPHNYVYDPNTLSWVPQQQGGSGGGVASDVNVTNASFAVTGPVTDAQLRAADVKVSLDGEQVAVAPAALLVASGSANQSGNNSVITPSAGKRIRLAYVSYNPSGAVEAAFRFGSSGTLFLRNNLVTGGSVIAKDFGDFRYVEGGVDQPLMLNLSAAVTTLWNALYTEV